jgi:hydroxymethylglutaryl-CoA synthase
MIGIVSYGAYIPLWRLSREAILKAWRQPSEQGERAVANFDEDSITMAVAATLDCLSSMDRHAVDGLFFATTTSPYKEKLGAAIVATAADLRRNIVTADFSNSLRSGTAALKAGIDAVKSGSMKQVLVVAADIRLGEPGSSWELNCGDGAAALLIGTSEVIAEIEASYSVCDEMMDIWRSQDDRFIRSAEGRFIVEEGYVRVCIEAISGLMKNRNFSEKDFKKVVFGLPEFRTQARLAKDLGFNVKTQLQDSMFFNVGYTGAAYSLMLLQAALEDASENDRILVVNYGNGSDVISVKVTDQTPPKVKNRGLKRYLNSRRVIDNYTTYSRWRDLFSHLRPARDFGSLSLPALLREVEANIRFNGLKCNVCGAVQYPPQEVCTKCHSRNQFEKVRLSDKKGRIITYSKDYLLTWMPEKPTIAAVVNFEGGGRVHAYMTDAQEEEIKIDMPVEMTFRLLDFREGIYQYIWKCVPVR